MTEKANFPAPVLLPDFPTVPDLGISKDLIKAIAMQIGKDTVAYVEVMYPEAIKATSSTFKLSLRNHIYNEIMSMVDLHDEMGIRENLFAKATFRKAWLKQYRKMRREPQPRKD